LVEIKITSDNPSSMAERIEKRTRNSGDHANADEVKRVGHSPNRTFTNVHRSRVHAWGDKDNEPKGDHHD
jgi:hypothetical protein